MGMIPLTGPNVALGSRQAEPLQPLRIPQQKAGATALMNAGNSLTQYGNELDVEHARRARMDEEAAATARHNADRAQTISVMAGAKDKLTDLHDQVTQGLLDGQVPKDGAESSFKDGAASVLNGLEKQLPQANRALVMAELNRDIGNMGNAVRRAVTVRDRQDVTAGIDQSLEYFQRQYLTNPVGAQKQADSVIDQLGPHSTYSPPQLAKLKQGWREQTQYTAGFQLVTGARDDRKALDAAEAAVKDGLPDLDPQKRAGLMDRIQVSRLHLDQKDEMAAQRAQREWERRMTTAKQAYDVTQSLADKGTLLDPGYVNDVMRTTAGTPYQAGIVALAKQAQESGGMAAQPIHLQQASLDALNADIARNGLTPELSKRRDQVEKVLRGSKADYQIDAMRAGLARGIITELKPLDFSQGMPGVLQQLQQRIPDAQRVSIAAGWPVSLMAADEADGLGQALAALPTDLKQGWMRGLGAALPPEFQRALAAQLKEKDSALALAMHASSLPATGGADPVALILRGQDATRSGRLKKDDEVMREERRKISRQLDAVPWVTPQARDAATEAAVFIQDGLRDQAGGAMGGFSKKAVQIALGGEIVDHGDSKTIAPPGWSNSRFNAAMRKLTAADIERQAPAGLTLNGQQLPAAALVQALPSARMLPLGPGRYALDLGGIVLGANRQYFAFNLRD